MLKVTFTHIDHKGDEQEISFKTRSLNNYPKYFNFFDITVDGEPVDESPVNLSNLDFSDDDIEVEEI